MKKIHLGTAIKTIGITAGYFFFIVLAVGILRLTDGRGFFEYSENLQYPEWVGVGLVLVWFAGLTVWQFFPQIFQKILKVAKLSKDAV